MPHDTHPWEQTSTGNPGKSMPEYRLWVAVMIRAMADLCSRDKRIADDARRWFLVENEMIEWICSILGLDPGHVRRVARELSSKPRGVIIDMQDLPPASRIPTILASFHRRAGG